MNPLYLGVTRKIITPEVGGKLYGYRPDVYSTSIADDLTVDAYYLKQGDTIALMINATVCLVAVDLCDRLRQEISRQFGIPADACTISTIHNHSGPCLAGSGAGWGDRDAGGGRFCQRKQPGGHQPPGADAFQRGGFGPEPLGLF